MPYTTIPASLVTSLVNHYPASREDLNAIRDPRAPSRFCSVYPHVHGGRYTVNAYRARVFKFFELSSGFDSAEQAAHAVVSFYKAHFGDHWRTAFRYRKVTPWRLRAVKRPTPGYAVDIFFKGRPLGITYADAGQGRSADWIWETSVEAKLAAREAMRRRFERERNSLSIPAPGLLFWRA